jgi:hypothetical protein
LSCRSAGEPSAWAEALRMETHKVAMRMGFMRNRIGRRVGTGHTTDGRVQPQGLHRPRVIDL